MHLLLARRWLHLVPVAALLAVTSVAAQQSVQMTDTGIENTLRVPVTVLALAQDAEGYTVGFRAMTVDPGQTARVPRGSAGTWQITRIEPIHPGVRVSADRFTCSRTRGVSAAAAIDSMRAEIRRLNLSDSPEAQAALDAYARLAQLELDQRLDELNTRRDIVSYQGLTATDSWSIEQDQRVQNQAATEQTVGTVLAYAASFSDVQMERQMMISDEAGAVAQMAARADSALPALRRAAAAALLDAQAEAAFAAEATTRLAPALAAGEAMVHAPVTRACPDQPVVSDVLQVTARAPAGQTALVAQARFDRGGTAPVLFRRVGTGDRWMARIAWPPAASRASLTFPRARGAAGEVALTRPSLDAVLRETERNAALLHRRARQLQFRAQGADHIKAVIVP